jgi:putative DNA primase/helicase
MSSKKTSTKSFNAISWKKTKSLSVTPRVVIVGEGCDEFNKRYFKFSVRGSQVDIPPFCVEKLVKDPKPLFAALSNAGWNAFTSQARNELLQKLQERKPTKPSFKVVTRLGWHSGAYVFGEEIIGVPRMKLEKAFGDLDHAMRVKYRTKGTLNEWQDQIAPLCKGNSRLMFGVCLAFTGPILSLVAGPKAGGFQLWGDPETGKTTAAMVAGSVWGRHRGDRSEAGFMESWNSTASKVEVTALAHNDALLILDETKQAGTDDRERAKIVTSVAFRLAEAVEKERLTNPTSARSWRCYFLSTSNLSLAELSTRGGVVIDDANRGRMADIPMPVDGHGIYEKLHGFASGQNLSDKLQQLCRKYYGTPAREFIRRLVRKRQGDARELKNFLKAERAAYRKALKRAIEAENLEQPLGRILDRCAIVFAAGSLARKYGIVSWNRKRILKAILSCQLDQLRQADGSDDSAAPSPESLRIKLVRYFNDHHEKFMYLNKKRPQVGSDKIDAVPGYRAKVDGERWYYLTSDQLRAVIGNSESAHKLKQMLANQGLLAQKMKGKFVIQRKVFAGGRGNKNYAWVHAFKADMLKTLKADPTKRVVSR